MAYQVDMETGLLQTVDFKPSPFADARPEGVSVDLLVIHGISLPAGEFGTPHVEALFLGNLSPDAHPSFIDLQGLKVSAHLVIDRTGKVTQYVPFHLRAWHAGESSFQGKSRCNDFSIGIELEGTDDLPYHPEQYTALRDVMQALTVAYPAITHDRVVGHSDIAPGRKTDPGSAFNWDYLRGIL